MRFQKGHKLSVGNKGGGRKSKAEEFESIRAKITEEITNELLLKRSQSAVMKQVIIADETENPILTQTFALPITLKGMTEKHEDVKILEIQVIEKQLAKIYDGDTEDDTISSSIIQRIGETVNINSDASRDIQSDLEKETSEMPHNGAYEVR